MTVYGTIRALSPATPLDDSMQRILPTLSFPKTAFQLLHSPLELPNVLIQLFFLGHALLVRPFNHLLLLLKLLITVLPQALQKRVAVLHSRVQEA